MPKHRPLITADDVRLAHGSLTVPAGAIITPSARDLAASMGIQIISQDAEAEVLAKDTPEPESDKNPARLPEELASRIDHTNLAPDATATDIVRLCDEAVRHGFAAVCVHPIRVALAATHLQGKSPVVCGVVGFPSGGHDPSTKAHEASLCVHHGAREIDMVAYAGLLRDDNVTAYHAGISAVRLAIGAEIILKVIVEAPLLDPENMVRAAVIAASAGASFVKTSTGVYAKAREEDVILLRRALPPEIRIKAAGGIRTAAQARAFVSMGADRLGTSSSVRIIGELIR